MCMTLASSAGRYWYSLLLPLLSLASCQGPANIIHRGSSSCRVLGLCWILKTNHRIPSSTQGCLNPTQACFSFIWSASDNTPLSPISVSPGLKTYLISGRKVEPQSHCGCSQVGLAGHEHADPHCPAASGVHTPDGAPSTGTLPPEGAKVSARYLWDNYMKH